METELLSAEEIDKVKTTLAQLEDDTDYRYIDKAEAKFLAGLVIRVANQAKLTNQQLNRTVTLLRAILKEVL